MASALENQTASLASGERLEESNISVLSNCVKLWKYFWYLLGFVGKRVDIGTGLAIIAFLGLVISGSAQLSTRSSLATHERRETRVFIPLDTFNYDSSSRPRSKPFGICQNLQSVINTPLSTVPAYSHTDESLICKIKPGAHHMKGTLPSSLQYQDIFEESSQLYDKTSGASKSTFWDKMNSGVLQVSKNVKKYFSDVDSGDNSEHKNLQVVFNIVNFLKNDFWSLHSLLAFCIKNILLGLDIRTAFVVLMILGIGIPATSSPWFDFPLLMYVFAYSLMFFSLILKFAPRRALQSHIMAGLAYTCAILGILGIIAGPLPLESACLLILIILVFAAFYVYSRWS